MPLAVVSYPKLSQAEADLIAYIRSIYPNLTYPKFAPHFTVVFPTQSLTAGALVEHVQARMGDQHAFSFTIRCALPMPDTLSDNTHLFLVPDEGLSQFVRLHDRLYTGVLAGELRLDIPFIPHITVGYTRVATDCKAAADAINRDSFAISGLIDRLDIVELNGDRLETVGKVWLV